MFQFNIFVVTLANNSEVLFLKMQKKISKQRAEFLQKQYENKAKARALYKANPPPPPPPPPPKKKASVRDNYKADPEKKKASVRDSYKADPEMKKASVRDSYKADPEMKKASVRDSYKADIESKRSAKRWRHKYSLGSVIEIHYSTLISWPYS